MQAAIEWFRAHGLRTLILIQIILTADEHE